MPLAVGQKARRSATLTAEHVRLYSEITGDYNPLHVDAAFTAATRFRKLIGAKSAAATTIRRN